MKNRKLLIVAYHFPPLQGSSGLHRALSWARHLPEDGWDVSVLTVTRNAYPNVLDENEALVPDNVRIVRVPAFDTIRSLSFKGRYPGFLALPDRFQSWILSAAAIGAIHCLRNRPDVILSTYPVASAHYIGRILSKLTGSSWVVDFRDPMAQENYPRDLQRRRSLHRLERKCMENASRIFVTTPGTRRLYAERYPDFDESRLIIIPNGYNDSMFDGTDTSPRPREGKTLKLLHSGALYKNERDPRWLFEALADLRKDTTSHVAQLQIMFRGTRHTSYFRGLAEQYGVESAVTFGESIPYQAAVEEIMDADGLLVLQASNCNDQIPAKIYEYLRARKPIVALTDPEGDTAQFLKSCSVSSIARLDDRGAIRELLQHFAAGEHQAFMAPDDHDIEQYSRRRIASQVSVVLKAVCN